MPLKRGRSRATVSANVAELVRAGRDPRQAAAIAYKIAGIAKDSAMRRKPIAFHVDSIPRGRVDMLDAFVIDGVRRTGDGYLAAYANVARTGVQTYKGKELGRPDLGDVRVYRPAAEVFHKDAMRSMAHRPVTLTHPPVSVGAKNWAKYAKGHTGDEVIRDGDHVRVPMVVMDAAAISAIEDGSAKELSMGYSTDLKWKKGRTRDGSPYDAVQTAIRANHLAIVPVARGGEALRIGDDKDEHGYGSNKRRIAEGGFSQVPRGMTVEQSNERWRHGKMQEAREIAEKSLASKKDSMTPSQHEKAVQRKISSLLNMRVGRDTDLRQFSKTKDAQINHLAIVPVARGGENLSIGDEDEPRDEHGRWAVTFNQPGTRGAQKQKVVSAATKEDAIKLAKKDMQQHGAGWKVMEVKKHTADAQIDMEDDDTCPKCGMEVSPDDDECPYCHEDLTQDADIGDDKDEHGYGSYARGSRVTVNNTEHPMHGLSGTVVGPSTKGRTKVNFEGMTRSNKLEKLVANKDLVAHGTQVAGRSGERLGGGGRGNHYGLSGNAPDTETRSQRRRRYSEHDAAYAGGDTDDERDPEADGLLKVLSSPKSTPPQRKAAEEALRDFLAANYAPDAAAAKFAEMTEGLELLGDAALPYWLCDKEFSIAQRKKLAKSGAAMPDGSFPISNTEDLHHAVQAVGRASNYVAAKKHIISRARALGEIASLPADWVKSNTTDAASRGKARGANTMSTMIVDGVPVEIDDVGEAVVKKLLVRLGDAEKKAAKYEADKEEADEEDERQQKDHKAALDAKDGEVAALKKQLGDAQALNSPEKLDALVKDRLAVTDAASKMLPATFSFDGKTVADIRRATVQMKLGDAVKDMSDAAIEGAFKALTADAARSGPSRLADAISLHQQRSNGRGGTEDLRDAAMADQEKHLNNAWRTPTKQ